MGEIPQPGDTVGRYTIGERLGQGGTGTVFRATRSLPRREVALKVIPARVAATPGFREQFLHERLVAQFLVCRAVRDIQHGSLLATRQT